MRWSWNVVVLLGSLACGAEQLGPEVPLARDCSDPAAALDLCDATAPDCAARIFAAVACFSDREPGAMPPIVRGFTEDDYLVSPFLPSIRLEPAMLEALGRLRVRGATLAFAGLLPELPFASAHDAPLRVIVAGDLTPASRSTGVFVIAEVFALALALRDQPLEARLLASAEDLDLRMGTYAMIFGQAYLHAYFTLMAAEDTSLAVDRPYPGPLAVLPTGLLHRAAQARGAGADVVATAFIQGGDPAVASLVAAAPDYTEVDHLFGFREGLLSYRAGRPPPLAEAQLRVPAGHRVVASFVGGTAFRSMAVDGVTSRSVRDRVALVDTPDQRVVVWAFQYDPERVPAASRQGQNAAEALRARGLDVTLAADDAAGWDVLVVATASTSSTTGTLARTALAGLPR